LRRACQKEDWRKHKRYCGKEKVTKQLPGTIRDPLWEHRPQLPDHFQIPETSPGKDVQVASLGFGTPHPSRPHNAALRLQLSLLTVDKDADYILFDEAYRPVRFVIQETFTKLAFRTIRSDAMFSAEPKGLEAIAEHLIKMMAHEPGLSRERIIAQLSREYGEDITDKVTVFQGRATVKGYPPGTTFVEATSKDLLPKLMQLRK
jgi:hypothetical protein